MEKKKIIEALKESDLTSIEHIEYKDENVFIVRFKFKFDDPELEAARAYANDECEEEEESDLWYDDFFIPYLNDLAVDNVGEIVEDIMSDFEVNGQFISYDIDEEEYEYNEFIAAFFMDGINFELEDILDELEL